MEAVGVVKDTYTGLLGTIERNAGENRIQTLTSSGILGTSLTDVRHSVLNDVNRGTSEILASNQQSLNVLTKHVTDGAWESRTTMASGFQQLSEEHLRTKNDLAQQAAQQYASNLLEGQKNLNFLTSKVDNQFAAMLSKNDGHYASLMLEQQKSAHHSDNKADNHFAALLSKQDNHFAAILLEQQKAKECLTLQLQEAKYEALKNKQDLSKEIGDCCCEVKQKIDQRAQDVINTVDTLDRNRLRDDLTVSNNENNLLKILEWYDDRGYDGYRVRGRGDRGSRGRR
jgi:ATP-dependent Lon protease